jgi:hypothetical protein
VCLICKSVKETTQSGVLVQVTTHSSIITYVFVEPASTELFLSNETVTDQLALPPVRLDTDQLHSKLSVDTEFL